MTELCEVIDAICDHINTRNRNNPGVDIVMHGVGAIEDTLCNLFSTDGNKMTAEFKHGDESIFCWAETWLAQVEWMRDH